MNGNRSAPASPTKNVGKTRAVHHLVGGGIASLAATVFLTRDAAVPGEHIRVYEQSNYFGGSLDGEGSPEKGHVIRGGADVQTAFCLHV